MVLVIEFCIQCIDKYSANITPIPTISQINKLIKSFLIDKVVTRIYIENDRFKFPYLENITNSRKDLVGKTQLCITDHVSPSAGMGGREVQSCFMPYILLRALENANLQPIMTWRKINPV